MLKTSVWQAHKDALGHLRADNINAAKNALVGYVPAMGHLDWEYGLWCLELSFLQAFAVESGLRAETTEVLDLVERARSTSPSEFGRLADWFHGLGDSIKEPLLNSEVFRLLREHSEDLPPELTLAYGGAVDPRLLAEEYKNWYEITVLLEALANVVRIASGQHFEEHPFEGKRHRGRRLVDKRGRVQKTNAIQWIQQSASAPVAQIIGAAYRADLRNVLGGHNAYAFDRQRTEYVDAVGASSFSYQEVEHTCDLLFLLHDCLCILMEIHWYEHHIWLLPRLGIMDIGWDTSADGVLELKFMQFDCNFCLWDESNPPRVVSFYRTPVDRRDAFSLSIGFDRNLFYPGDLRVFASTETLRMLEKVKELDSIDCLFVAVRPPLYVAEAQAASVELHPGRSGIPVRKRTCRLEVDGSTTAATASTLREWLSRSE